MEIFSKIKYIVVCLVEENWSNKSKPLGKTNKVSRYILWIKRLPNSFLILKS